jgi:hypothetical protein
MNPTVKSFFRWVHLSVGNRSNYSGLLDGKTIWGKTIKAFRTMVLPWFLGSQNTA